MYEPFVNVNNMLVHRVLCSVKLTWTISNATGQGRNQLAPTLRFKDTSCQVHRREKLKLLHCSTAQGFCKFSTLEMVKNVLRSSRVNTDSNRGELKLY